MNDFSNGYSIGGPGSDCGILELSSEDIDLVSGGRVKAIKKGLEWATKKVGEAVAWIAAFEIGAKAIENLDETEEPPPPPPENECPLEQGEEVGSVIF